jgi:hypothetical protein
MLPELFTNGINGKFLPFCGLDVDKFKQVFHFHHSALLVFGVVFRGARFALGFGSAFGFSSTLSKGTKVKDSLPAGWFSISLRGTKRMKAPYLWLEISY